MQVVKYDGQGRDCPVSTASVDDTERAICRGAESCARW